jgi:hypothetical protein
VLQEDNTIKENIIIILNFIITANVFVLGKLRFCQRGISEGNSEVGKNAINFGLAPNLANKNRIENPRGLLQVGEN